MKGITKICSYINGNKYLSVLVIIVITGLFDGPFLQLSQPLAVDEFSSILLPVYLVGGETSVKEVVSTLGFHGWGHTVLLTPLFAFIDSAVIRYKLLLLECLIFRMTAAVLSYVLLKNCLKVDNGVALVAAVACNLSTMTADETTVLSALTEIPIAFICVLFTTLVYRGILCETKKIKKVLCAVSASICVAYSVAVHSRSIIIIFSIVLVAILYMLLERKKKLYVLVFFVSFFVITIVINYFQTNIEAILYSVGEGEKLNNTVSTVMSSAGVRLSSLMDGFKIKMFGFLSLMASFSLYTFGMVWIFAYANIWMIFTELKKKFKNKVYEVNKCIYGSSFAILTFGGMNFAIAISMKNLILDENYKWLTYIRYGKPFLWLVMLLGIYVLYHSSINLKRLGMAAFLTHFFLSKFFYVVVADLLDSSGYRMGYTVFNRIFCNTKLAREYFGMAMVCGIISFLAVMFFLRKRKNIIMSLLLITIISLPVIYSSYKYFIKRDGSYFNVADSSVELADALGEETIKYGGSKRYYLYFTWNSSNKERIVFVNNIDKNLNVDFKGDMILSDIANLDIPGYECFALDDNEYIYLNNNADYEKVKAFLAEDHVNVP